MDLDALRVTVVDTDKVCIVANVGIRFDLHKSQKGRLLVCTQVKKIDAN